MGTQGFAPPGTAEPMRLRLSDLRSNGVRDLSNKNARTTRITKYQYITPSIIWISCFKRITILPVMLSLEYWSMLVEF